MRNTTIFYIANSVRNFTQVMNAVFYDNDSLPCFFPSSDNFGQVRYGFKIKIRRRFIEYENFRTSRSNRRTGNFLFFATGHMEYIAPGQVFHAKFLHDIIHSLQNLFTRHAHIFAAKCNFAISIDIKKLRTRILENRAHTPRNFGKSHVGSILFAQKHIARHAARIIMRNQPVNQLRNGRLATARLPRQNHAFARTDFKVQILDDRIVQGICVRERNVF